MFAEKVYSHPLANTKVTMPNTTTEIQVHAARLCQAIARIGYEPQTALLDIVDNSVTANATSVRISLHLVPGKTLKNRNSVLLYQVVDNGVGMTNEEVVEAFSLGANGDYMPHSLSKYGMGLKSAGLSLGTRINIISKKDGVLSRRNTFDLDLIERENKFIVSSNVLSTVQVEKYSSLLGAGSGTIVEIDGCENINHQSPNTTVKKLEDEMGVIYEKFISASDRSVDFQIRVCVAGEDASFKRISPLDILFLNGPQPPKAWDPATYDYKSPYLLLDESWKPDLGDGKTTPPIKLKVVAFPQDALGDLNSPLPVVDKNIVKLYKVGRNNAGFFIYRNERLIRWGDKLDILGKDEFNIRVRMDITEEHDDVLHVDVTKQRFEIDDELLARLRRIVDEPRTIAKSIMKLCHELLKKPSGREGERFSSLSENVTEDDPEEMARGTPHTEVLERQQQQAEEANVIRRTTDSNIDGAGTPQSGASFSKVRYTSEVQYSRLWRAYRDAKEGVFVCINTAHPFYTEFMRDLADNSPSRVLLETLVFGCGVAEINTMHNLYEIEIEVIKSVFERFHKNCATYLANFTTENINLIQEGAPQE